MTDFCANITCLNHGVCRSRFLNYTCECLDDSYSGRHCEQISARITMRKVVSKSFAFVAITAVIVLCLFFVFMDVLKYLFGMDVTRNELIRIRRRTQRMEKQPRPKTRTVQRIAYIS